MLIIAKPSPTGNKAAELRVGTQREIVQWLSSGAVSLAASVTEAAEAL